jgi:hypothetical protein
MKIRTVFSSIALLALLLGVFALEPVSSASADGLTILKFGTMVGVPKAYTGATNPLRGINGGGLPWVIAGAEGKLTASGKLDIEVNGLVLDPNDPTVISRGLAGVNPSATFRAIVSCQNSSGGVNNVMTDPFPATTGPASSGGGNAELETKVSLPRPCIAPIVFVASPGGAWFAATGY